MFFCGVFLVVIFYYLFLLTIFCARGCFWFGWFVCFVWVWMCFGLVGLGCCGLSGLLFFGGFCDEIF